MLRVTVTLMVIFCFVVQSEQTVYNDAVALVMYYMKKASSLSRDESVKIKYFMIHTLADFCYHHRSHMIH